MNSSGVKSIAINAAYLSSARAITSLARAIYAILLAKFLGAEFYGIFSYGLSWYILFVPISVMGLDTILLREIGLKKDKAHQLVGQTLALRSVSSIVIAALSVIIGYFFEPDPMSRSLLLIFSFALVGRGLSLWVNTIFKAHETSEYVLYQEVAFRSLEVIVGIVLLFSGFGVVSLAMVHSGIWIIQGLVGIVLIQRILLPVQVNWKAKKALRFIKQGIPFILGAFFISWLLQGPIIMFRHFFGIGEELGYIAMALQAFTIIAAIVAETGGAATPVLSRSVNRKDGKSNIYIDVVLRIGLMMGGVLVIAAVSMGDWLLNLILGNGYEPVSQLLIFALAITVPHFWLSSLQSLVIAHAKYWMIAINYALGAVVFTVSFPLLIQVFNSTGVLFALGLGLLSVVSGQVVTLIKQNQKIEFVSSIFKPLCAVAISIVVCSLLTRFNMWAALISGLVTLVIFLIILGGIKQEEINIILELIGTKNSNRNAM